LRVLICDKCGTVLPEDFLEHDLSSKNEVVLCPDCLEIEKSQEHFFCDRCRKPFPVKAIRGGEAVLILESSKGAGAIYCKRCRAIYRRHHSETKELKHLLLLFGCSIAIPIITSIYLYFRKTEIPPAQQTEISVDKIAQEVHKTLGKELASLKKEIEALKPQPPLPPTKKTEELPQAPSMTLILQLPDLIAQKAAGSFEAKFKKGNLVERLEAIQEIARLRELSAIPLLVEGLKDPDPLVRNFSARALGFLAAQQEVGKLVTALSDPEPIVKRAVSQSLSVLTTERFIFFQDLSQQEWQKLKEMKEK
jgi:hypothetical protein